MRKYIIFVSKDHYNPLGIARTQVSDEEKAARAYLFVVPEKEKNPADVKTTLKYMKFAPWLGLVVIVVLLVVWVLPLWS